jgi:protein disulfide-isomerase
LVLGYTSLVFGQTGQWLTDLPAARLQAKRETRFMLLNFTVSDSDGECIKLKSEVFDTPQFMNFASSNLVLVEVDLPRNRLMTQEQKDTNRNLAALYHVTAYPTLFILDWDGRQMGRVGYVKGGPEAFLKELEREGEITKTLTAEAHKPEIFKLPPSPLPIRYGPLALKAISGPKERRMVLINNASMMQGETAKVRTQGREVEVCCKEIRENSVLIACNGESLELKLVNH